MDALKKGAIRHAHPDYANPLPPPPPQGRKAIKISSLSSPSEVIAML